MANTYCQIFVHIIFAVKYREGVIAPSWQQELYSYMVGLVENREHKVLAIGGMKDHIHILVSMSPKKSVSDLVHDIKRASTNWVKERHFVRGRFAWQEGYGAFSYGKSQIDKVVHYIRNQKEHHIGKTMKEEYIDFLKAFGTVFDEKYVLKDVGELED